MDNDSWLYLFLLLLMGLASFVCFAWCLWGAVVLTRWIWKNLQWYSSSNGFWFRLFGCGLNVTNTRKLFSERNGYVRSLPLPYGWRVKYLPRDSRRVAGRSGE